MARKSVQILIVEDDIWFRNRLENICTEIGETYVAGNFESALTLLAQQPYDLLLLDWELSQISLPSLHPTIEHFQPNVPRMALFTRPTLDNVIQAMKSGAQDGLWAAQTNQELAEKIQEALSGDQPDVHAHSFASGLADSLIEKAMAQKTPLFQARREFSKTFLQQVLSHQKLGRIRLAKFVGVSPRTLHRHLTG